MSGFQNLRAPQSRIPGSEAWTPISISRPLNLRPLYLDFRISNLVKTKSTKHSEWGNSMEWSWFHLWHAGSSSTEPGPVAKSKFQKTPPQKTPQNLKSCDSGPRVGAALPAPPSSGSRLRNSVSGFKIRAWSQKNGWRETFKNCGAKLGRQAGAVGRDSKWLGGGTPQHPSTHCPQSRPLVPSAWTQDVPGLNPRSATPVPWGVHPVWRSRASVSPAACAPEDQATPGFWSGGGSCTQLSLPRQPSAKIQKPRLLPSSLGHHPGHAGLSGA